MLRTLPRAAVLVFGVSQIIQTPPPVDRRFPVLPLILPYWQLAVLAFLLLWLYWSTLVGLVSQWWHDPNFTHGFLVPLFSAYVLWQDRDRLERIAPRPSWTGLFFIAFGLSLLMLGQLGAELFLARFSILLLLAGTIVFFLGWNYFREVIFPWAFLILMIPIPTIIFNQITFPLQLLASKVAAAVLPLFGVPIFREGNVIHLPVGKPLEVAEACSGIRSLMSLGALAIIYGYLMERRIWVRVVLALASVPVAIVANSGRIVGTGLLVRYWDPDKAEAVHPYWGWIVFVVSLLLLYALHSLIRVLFREENE